MTKCAWTLTEISRQVKPLGPGRPLPEEEAIVRLPVGAIGLIALCELIKVSLHLLHLGQALLKQPVPSITQDVKLETQYM